MLDENNEGASADETDEDERLEVHDAVLEFDRLAPKVKERALCASPTPRSSNYNSDSRRATRAHGWPQVDPSSRHGLCLTSAEFQS